MGHTYVMSDIHGMAELLEKMLRKIAFSPADMLYILGDMIDRGPDPAGVIASRKNIVALRGNHEDMFAEWYEYTEDKSEGYFYNTYEILMSSDSAREKIPEYVRWMKKLPLYKKVKSKDTCYVMAHASTEGIFEIWKKKDTFLWESGVTGSRRSLPGYISIVGHVPTFILRGYSKEPAERRFRNTGDGWAAFAWKPEKNFTSRRQRSKLRNSCRSARNVVCFFYQTGNCRRILMPGDYPLTEQTAVGSREI